MSYLICPFSQKEINASAARVNAVYTFLFLAVNLYVFPGYTSIILIIDFFIKGFLTDYIKSPLSVLSSKTALLLKIPPKMKNAGPKIFAAKIGLTMSVFISVFGFLNFNIVMYALSALFMTLVLIELFTGFCMGCYMYTICMNIKSKITGN